MTAKRPRIVIGNWQGPRELIIFLQGRLFPTIEEGHACYEACQQLARRANGQFDHVGCLVFNDGGGPTARQREGIRAFLDGRLMRTAVVSPSRLTHGIMAAIALFNPEMRSFAPRDVERAFRYLDVPPDGTASLWAEINRLDAAIGGLDVFEDMRREGHLKSGAP
jgi:hypothetical protein